MLDGLWSSRESDQEAMRVQECFRAAFGAAAFEQHDCAALMGLEAGRRHGGGTGMGAALYARRQPLENRAQLALRDTIGTRSALIVDIIVLFPP
jgi:hypothetical protein